MKTRAKPKGVDYLDPRGQRKHPRKKGFLHAWLEADAQPYECLVLDLSPGGAMIELAHHLADRQAVVLSIEPLGTFPGTVVWQAEGRAGIKFEAGRRAEKTNADSLREIMKLTCGKEGVVILKPGEALCGAADPSGLYVVRSGRLQVQESNGTSKYLGIGGMLGEIDLAETDLPPCTAAIAVTDCELVKIDSRHFFSLIEEAFGFAVTVMQALGGGPQARTMAGRLIEAHR
jgi:hypothetical protein